MSSPEARAIKTWLDEGGEGHDPVKVTYSKLLGDQHIVHIVVQYDECGMVLVSRQALEMLLVASGYRQEETRGRDDGGCVTAPRR